jgi:hypothetical protein
MLSTLEKHQPLISIVLLSFLLTSLWLWPEMQGLMSLVIIILSVGMLFAFTVHRRMEENRKGLIDRSTMAKIIILDCAGIMLVLVSAMAVGSYVSKVVGTAVYSAMRESAPRWAEEAAIAFSLLSALAAGAGVGWLVRSAWARVEIVFTRDKTQASGA